MRWHYLFTPFETKRKHALREHFQKNPFQKVLICSSCTFAAMAHTATNDADGVFITLKPKRMISNVGASDSAVAVAKKVTLHQSAPHPSPKPSSRVSAGSWNCQHEGQRTAVAAARDGARFQARTSWRDDNTSDAIQRGTKRNFDRCDMYTEARSHRMLDPNERVQQYDIIPIESILTCFAAGWFPPAAYKVLHTAVKTLVPTGSASYTVISSLVSFEKGLFQHSAPDMVWSRPERFTHLAVVRQKYGEDFVELSDAATTACMWEYSNNFILNAAQRDMPSSKKRSIISYTLDKTLGGQRRVRALLKLGFSTFENVNNESDMLKAFLLYIVKIEQLVEEQGVSIAEHAV